MAMAPLVLLVACAFCGISGALETLMSDRVIHDLDLCNTYNLTCKLREDTALEYLHEYSAYGTPFQYKLEQGSFFRRADLFHGRQFKMVDLRDGAPRSPFLPEKITKLFPFYDLKVITELFGIAPGSNMEKEMNKTIQACNQATVKQPWSKSSLNYDELNNAAARQKKEIQACLFSVESIAEFAQVMLGSNDLELIAADKVGSKMEVEIKHIFEVDLNEGKLVACHNHVFPYGVYFCHLVPQTKLFKVLMESGVITIAMCHYNTSNWSPISQALKSLNLEPGVGEVCHWCTENSLTWFKSPAMNKE